ncbi:MAG TPA: 1,4-dihydroxy-2-naphthoate octaprenyltransferase, partial [Bacteroidales bacterium]|nr:1,4-dihydroxy-2-naphthoate octaprenyltransferase [Bacteroidales bacterium]
MKETILKEWIDAARPRTLPLSLSSTLMGSFMALSFHQFSWSVFILAMLTTVMLQILANLANDYGDTLSGVDNKERIGPKRGLQRGAISLQAMRNAIIINVLLSVIFGIWLILEGLHYRISIMALIYLLMGFAAILAAIKYTVGRNPYGYVGLGDLFVFIFFGPVGVAGTYYLHTNTWDPCVWLPSISLGLFSVAVLNINNIIIHSFVNISIIIRTLMSRYMSFNNSLSTYSFNLWDTLSIIMSLKADYFTAFSFCGTFCPARCPAKPLF